MHLLRFYVTYHMEMKSIVLPSNVFENDMGSFLSLVSNLQHANEIDLKNIKYYMPAAITSLLCNLVSTQGKGNLKFIYDTDSSGFRYFQRMNFFRLLFPNIDIPENFNRHVAINFSPIMKIDNNSDEKVISDTIISSIWGKRFLTEDEKPNICAPIQYAIGEIVRNVVQHSESYGYIASQYYPTTGLIRIGLSDMGIGILESFKKNNSPFYDKTDTHLSMLKKALENRVSSKTHMPLPPYSTGYENQGVGLTMLKTLAKMTCGYFFVATGDAFSLTSGDNPVIEKNFDGFFQGTICSIAFSRNQLDKYPYDELRRDLFNEVMGPSDINIKSEDLFV